MAEMYASPIRAAVNRQDSLTSRALPGTDFDLRHQRDIGVVERTWKTWPIFTNPHLPEFVNGRGATGPQHREHSRENTSFCRNQPGKLTMGLRWQAEGGTA
jgi:hypothetical protein